MSTVPANAQHLWSAVADGAACVGQWDVFSPSMGRKPRSVIETCHTCPVFDLCDELAQVIQPTAGIWAGVNYNRPAPREDIETTH